DQRDVHESLVGPVLLSALDLATIKIDSGAEAAHVGLVGDVADRTSHRAGPEGGPLWSAQYLYALDVVEMQVRLYALPAERHVIEEEPGGGSIAVVRGAAVGGAAHHHDLGARADADEGQIGRLLGVVLEARDPQILHVLVGEDVDAQGDVL